MTKRIIALFLGIVCLAGCLVSCHDPKIDGENVKGAEITMYISEMVYDLDPAVAYNNDSALQICGLLFDTLFTLDSKGKVQKSIVDSYVIKKDEKNHEYSMMITLKGDNCWSDGTYVSAQDVVYSWKRILNPEFNSEAAALLYDVKNAREVKQGDLSIDDLGVYAVDKLVLEVHFVGDIDYDRFMLNLTSVALAPLREDIIEKNGDWAKKPATMVSSGAFILRRVNYGFDSSNNVDPSAGELVLERNPYYRRSKEAKYLDTTVAPYRLIVDFSMSKEQQLEAYANGTIFYVGDIALSVRNQYVNSATVTDLMSTHTYYMNENAEIQKSDGTTAKLFADKNVRLALSAAIDRTAIANAVVFARAATALVPYGVFETDSKKSLFRAVGGDILSASADTAAAQSYISAAGITPSDYTFAISVRGEDEVHTAIADAVCASWAALGFNVSVNRIAPAINDEPLAGEEVLDIYDDTFNEKFDSGDYEVIAIDLGTYTPDAYSVLAPFATSFSGQGQDMAAAEYIDVPHKTGYSNADYNAIIEQVFTATDSASRATLLHQAEGALLADMPVIPIIFNQNACLYSGDISGYKSTYYGFRIFTKLKQKNYMNYIETVAEK